MARNGAILGLGGSVADRDHIQYVPLSILGLAAFGVTDLPPCYADSAVSSFFNTPRV